MTAKPPEPRWAPAMAPSLLTSSSFLLRQSPPSIDFSPPLIAMVVVAALAFLIVTYSRLISRHLFPPFQRFRRRYRRWRRRRRLRPHFPPSDSESPPPFYESSDGFYVYSPYGLDESVIKSITLSIYKVPKSGKSLSVKLGLSDEEFQDCAVCLLEFEDGDYYRTLPLCSHSFHVDCIDIWLRSHATCPLCRAGIVVPPAAECPLTPIRMRPSSVDDEGILLESMFLEPLLEQQRSGEIEAVGRDGVMLSPGMMVQSEEHRCQRELVLKRSYSFGFERSLASATTPQRDNRRRRSLWSGKSRVFWFRQQERMKSPAFFRRRGFLPMSESWGWSGRMKYMAGCPPMLPSSRMRCGDPEALISPERYSRR